MKNRKNPYIINSKQFILSKKLDMVNTEDMLMWYRVYKNVLEEKDEKESDYDNHDTLEYQERQEEIENIMDEYWVDEDEAEEILDNI